MQLVKKTLKYFSVGWFATACNLIILFICVDYFKLFYLTGTVIAFCCSTTISFFLYKLWAFQNYSKDKMRMQYFYTLLFAALMIGLNTLLVYTFVELIMPWHLGYLVAQVLASIVTTLVNYIFYHKIIFKEKEIKLI